MSQFSSVIQLSSLDGATGFRLDGATQGGTTGYSVASAGDINDDGFADLLVGAFGENATAGATYVIYGQAGGFPASLPLAGVNGFRINGVAAGDRAGASVAGLGDFNGDGFGDFIIGAFNADPNGTSSGASYVVFGGPAGPGTAIDLSALDGTNGFRLEGVAADDLSGFSVAGSGDINGDGFADLIIGAYNADPNGGSSGASYVVFGKASGFASTLSLSALNGTNGFRIAGVAAGDLSGISISDAGDFNNDGFADLIIGAQQADPNGSGSGSSYIVFGKAGGFSSTLNLTTLNGTNGFRIDGVAASNYTGRSVSGAGDVNGDGFADVIMGAWGADGAEVDSGASYVVFGKASGFLASFNLSALNGTNGFRLDGVTTGDRNGFSVAGAGDVNGDGFADIIIGAYGADPNGNDSAGASYVVFGRASGFASAIDLSALDGTNGFRIDGVGATDLSGRSVASAGDINGDGFADLIVGGHLADPNGVNSGASYVIFGRKPDAAVIRTGTSADQTLAGGDFNDMLSAFGGGDRLYGHGGKDIMNGGTGSDTMFGGAGNDRIIGGAGKDVTSGGVNRDIFDFNSIADSRANAAARDLITDFNANALDKIDLSTIDANADGGTANDTFSFMGTGGFTGLGEVRYRQFDRAGTANDFTLVEINTTGTIAPEMRIELKGLVTLDAADFVL